MRRIKNKSNCAILVNSCDKYEDAWIPFFKLLKKNWKNLDMPIYLNTEYKQFACESFNVNTINCFDKVSWSQRLKRALKRIKEDYVLMFLEDFFLHSAVKEDKFYSLLKSIKQDKQIANFSFMPIEGYSPMQKDSSCYQGFYLREKNMRYLLTTQIALWRKKDLISFLSRWEDAWQFEQYGSLRAKLYNKKFYIAKKGNKIFDYCYSIQDGYGICNGKWMRKTKELFEDNGIHVEFHKLGFFDGNNPNAEALPPKKCFKWKWRYLLYGGCDSYYTSLGCQMVFLVLHPRTYWGYIKTKLRFVFECNIFD